MSASDVTELRRRTTTICEYRGPTRTNGIVGITNLTNTAVIDTETV